MKSEIENEDGIAKLKMNLENISAETIYLPDESMCSDGLIDIEIFKLSDESKFNIQSD